MEGRRPWDEDEDEIVDLTNTGSSKTLSSNNIVVKNSWITKLAEVEQQKAKVNEKALEILQSDIVTTETIVRLNERDLAALHPLARDENTVHITIKELEELLCKCKNATEIHLSFLTSGATAGDLATKYLKLRIVSKLPKLKSLGANHAIVSKLRNLIEHGSLKTGISRRVRATIKKCRNDFMDQQQAILSSQPFVCMTKNSPTTVVAQKLEEYYSDSPENILFGVKQALEIWGEMEDSVSCNYLHYIHFDSLTEAIHDELNQIHFISRCCQCYCSHSPQPVMSLYQALDKCITAGIISSNVKQLILSHESKNHKQITVSSESAAPPQRRKRKQLKEPSPRPKKKRKKKGTGTRSSHSHPSHPRNTHVAHSHPSLSKQRSQSQPHRTHLPSAMSVARRPPIGLLPVASWNRHPGMKSFFKQLQQQQHIQTVHQPETIQEDEIHELAESDAVEPSLESPVLSSDGNREMPDDEPPHKNTAVFERQAYEPELIPLHKVNRTPKLKEKPRAVRANRSINNINSEPLVTPVIEQSNTTSVPTWFQRGGPFYHTHGWQLFKEEDLGYDSEAAENVDTDWVLEYNEQLLDDFTDVQPETILFEKRWNRFMYANSFTADSQVPSLCTKFVNTHSEFIRSNSLQRVLLEHLMLLWKWQLINKDVLHDCMIKVNEN